VDSSPPQHGLVSFLLPATLGDSARCRQRWSPELATRHDRGLDALQTVPLAGGSLNFVVNAIAEIEDKKR
jgi:hypothetical protein